MTAMGGFLGPIWGVGGWRLYGRPQIYTHPPSAIAINSKWIRAEIYVQGRQGKVQFSVCGQFRRPAYSVQEVPCTPRRPRRPSLEHVIHEVDDEGRYPMNMSYPRETKKDSPATRSYPKETMKEPKTLLSQKLFTRSSSANSTL